MGNETVLKFLRKAARVWGGLILVFWTAMTIGHIVMPDSETGPTLLEFAGFVLLPGGLMAGLALAYKHELAGGLIAISSYLIHGVYKNVTRPSGFTEFNYLLEPFFFLMVAPAFLYLVLGFVSRKRI